MADASFDAVIVGGGNKALILAMYLTKYGKMSVGIFEDRHELGGGWSSEEPSPGFIGNTCSMYHSLFHQTPVYWDFPEWKTYGARYAYTKVGAGCIFSEDDTCFTWYTAFDDVDPDQTLTAANIARYSRKDADTWLWLWDKWNNHWRAAFLEHLYNPAVPLPQPDALDKLIQNPESGIDPVWMTMSASQFFQDLFEDPHMRHAFARILQSGGVQWDMAGGGFAGLLIGMYFYNHGCYAVGSSHALAHASHKVIIENGGKIFTNHKVDEILIDNGKARGIRLQNGSEIEAKKLVATTIDPHQLCFELIGREHLSTKILRRIGAIERDWISLMWYTWSLKERPRYKAEAWNEDIWQSQWTAFGDMDLRTFTNESCERKMFKWPSKLNIGAAYHGANPAYPEDQMISPPENNFTVLTEQFVLPAWALSEAEWKEWEKRHAEEVVELWNKYAPNVTWDIISGYTPVTPFYTAKMCRNYAPAGNWCVIDIIPSQFGRFRPIPELARHKIPGIENLYVGGAGWHPYGGAHAGQGYNCYKVITEDFDLIKPWEKEGRPF